ncbi:MAG: hypothetical protein HY931_01480 [Candidatus Falkowbacteria bacterium]|nr:MAG: hypothetical protein HY931_01480 [Candidatus Falkowbacteria bacterium]
MEKKLWEDKKFIGVLIASIIIALIMPIVADTGSFWKDVFCGIGIGALSLLAISSAFMPKC